MKTEQFIDIKTKLAKWREERGLSVEGQRKNFKVNYTKELVEFFEAKRDNNEYEMIDALCDMLIVAINAGLVFNDSDEGLFKNCIKNESIATTDYVIRAIREFELVQEGILISDSLALLSYYLYYLGYDPYKCLLETIKELNSRTGSWSEEEGKWVKDKGAYTKEEARVVAKEILKKDYVEYPHSVLRDGHRYWQFVSENHFEIKEWYKADYESCKLER